MRKAYKVALFILLGIIAGTTCATVLVSLAAASINRLDDYEMQKLALAEYVRSAIENNIVGDISIEDCVSISPSVGAKVKGRLSRKEFNCSTLIGGREFYTLTTVSTNGFEYGTWDWID